MTAPAWDVVTVGRIGIDLYPEQIATPLRDVTTFRKMLGGSPTNVAVAARRLGCRSAVVTKVGSDGFGDAALAALERFGVGTEYVGRHTVYRTPLAFCEIYPPDDFPLLFYRDPMAPDLTIESEDLPDEAVVEPRLLWVTATGLSVEPSRSATLGALTRRAGAGPSDRVTVLDLDHRPELWGDAAHAGPLVRQALPYVDVAIGNRAEVATAVGDLPAADAAEALLDLGVGLAVVKLGPDGVLAATRAEMIQIAPVPVPVVNGLGAGDAFGGAFCHGLLAGWELERTVRFANAAGAVVAGRLGCADDMPTVVDVQTMLGSVAA